MRSTILLYCYACISLHAYSCTSNKPVSDQNKSAQDQDTILRVMASGLEVPWGMDFLPDGRLLFNERPGRINILNMETGEVTLLMERSIWDHAEGGLLGLAVDPAFALNHYVFIYETVTDGNRIVRLRFENEILVEDTVILSGIPRKLFHDGGVLRFGPDGYLYAGTGDARDPDKAQDITSLSGKILRMDRNGNPAAGNPFHNYVYSYGHRNVQGLAWSNEGYLFATEHGPSGELNGWCCHDELNIIHAGYNYGWPLVIGDMQAENMTGAVMQSGDDTWAPGGIAFDPETQTFVVACLRGEELLFFSSDTYLHARSLQTSMPMSVKYAGEYGRLRNVICTPQGDLLFCTSNRDGRGKVQDGDDKLILLKMH